MQRRPLPIHGRGAASNPPNRFERIHYEPGPDLDASDAPAPATPFYRDLSRSVQIVSKVVKFHSPVAWSRTQVTLLYLPRSMARMVRLAVGFIAGLAPFRADAAGSDRSLVRQSQVSRYHTLHGLHGCFQQRRRRH